MWRGENSKGLAAAILMALIATACSGTVGSGAGDTVGSSPSDTSESSPTDTDASSPGDTSDGDESATTTTGPATTTTGGDSSTAGVAPCEIPGGQPFIETQSVELTDLGEVDGARVSAAVYPHPDYEGDPWTQWGQGIALEDGRYYSAIGDHLAEDGNSYVYEYDPSSNALTMVGDILSYVDHVPGTWGYGKIHSQMVPGPCDEIYFSTYWGSYRGIEFEGNYRGDIIFRLDPFEGTLQPLDVPVDFHGQASMASAPDFGVVYGEAIDPVLKNEDTDRGPFFAYDVVAEEVVYTGSDEPHVGYRSILVDADGVAYYSIGDGQLQTYDPETGDSVVHEERLPGDWLRAATDPGPDGTIYGVTREPDTFFAMSSDGSINALGDALGYTASMALSPDGSTFYYMPGAHGNSADWGSPLVAVDTSSGEETVVAELHDIVEESLGYRVGGTYNVAVSRDGTTVFMGVNVGASDDDDGFGEVVLLVIELP